ncbi:MAG: hypothetical protein MZV64_63640 [Ignavibacteriales bacterium]|nr:hypothetical protein [Ignavibacteriales bacterium]
MTPVFRSKDQRKPSPETSIVAAPSTSSSGPASATIGRKGARGGATSPISIAKVSMRKPRELVTSIRRIFPETSLPAGRILRIPARRGARSTAARPDSPTILQSMRHSRRSVASCRFSIWRTIGSPGPGRGDALRADPDRRVGLFDMPVFRLLPPPAVERAPLPVAGGPARREEEDVVEAGPDRPAEDLGRAEHLLPHPGEAAAVFVAKTGVGGKLRPVIAVEVAVFAVEQGPGQPQRHGQVRALGAGIVIVGDRQRVRAAAVVAAVGLVVEGPRPARVHGPDHRLGFGEQGAPARLVGQRPEEDARVMAVDKRPSRPRPSGDRGGISGPEGSPSSRSRWPRAGPRRAAPRTRRRGPARRRRPGTPRPADSGTSGYSSRWPPGRARRPCARARGSGCARAGDGPRGG